MPRHNHNKSKRKWRNDSGVIEIHLLTVFSLTFHSLLPSSTGAKRRAFEIGQDINIFPPPARHITNSFYLCATKNNFPTEFVHIF
jgi:hypothetical protein